jgi:cell division protein FtsI (penicillin-binding protein 3)
MNDRGLQRRLAVMALLIATMMVGLGGRLAWLHLGPNDDLRAGMNRAREVRQTIIVSRGRILDRTGAILATDRRLYDLNADPERLLESGLAEAVSAHVARVLGLSREDLLERCRRPHRRQVYLANRLTEEEADRVRAMKLPHIWFDEVSSRYYPQGMAACHVIGFSNVEGRGLAGIELAFDTHLRGVPGERESLRDARGREQFVRRLTDRPPVPGDTIELTLDLNIQRMVEEALETAQSEHNALGAWAIVMDPHTGEILALAARPGFDLNEFGRAPADTLLNRALGYSYEPGSTIKALTFAAAFNEGLTTPETVLDCEHGTWIHRGRPLRDYHPYGRLSVADVLKKSSNIGTAKIALLLGERKLETYLRAFGLGQRSALELPGEETGVLRPAAQWDGLALSRISIGHSVMVTSLQIVTAISTLANDGVRLRPTLVREVRTDSGVVLNAFRPREEARAVRPETARLVMELLARVAEEGGTGRRAAVPGYAVAGKTGTTTKLTEGRYDSGRNIASFVGVVPADAPRLAMIVVVDEPQPARTGTGGAVAAPVFARIAKEALRYLDVPPGGPVRVIRPESEEPLDAEEGFYDAGIAF